MKAQEILWWCCYITSAMIIQKLIPGFDAMVPAFLLCLQEKKNWHVVWCFLAFTLLQEGTGTLSFGTAILWYSGIIILFRFSAQLFVADNFLFVAMLSTGLGLLHMFLIWLMCSIQDIDSINYFQLFLEGLQLSLLTPLFWGLTYLLRLRYNRHVH